MLWLAQSVVLLFGPLSAQNTQSIQVLISLELEAVRHPTQFQNDCREESEAYKLSIVAYLRL